MSRLIMLAVTALVLSGCYSTARIEENTPEAKRQLLAVRPRADLSDITIRPWRSLRAYRQAHEGLEDTVTLATVNDGIKAQIALVRRLGVLTKEQHDQLASRLEMADAHNSAFAVPPKGLVYLGPGGDSVQTIIHELSHILSYRFGYYESAVEKGLLKPSEGIDERWIDLDALLAGWALEEGMAELTEAIAWYGGEHGPEMKRGIWQAQFKLEDVLRGVPHLDMHRTAEGTGSVTIHRTDGAIFEIRLGQPFPEIPELALPQKMIAFVYEQSQHVVKRLPFPETEQGVVDLDLALARAWAEFSFTTYQVLFPDENPGPSRLTERFRTQATAKETSVGGATRVGAFFVREFVLRASEMTPEDASAQVRRFRDDILLRDANDALLWISQWESGEAAEWFAAAYQAANPQAATRRQESYVIVNIGAFDNEQAALTALIAE